MKRVFLVLTKSKSLLSRIMDLSLPSYYYHSSICFDSSIDEMYSVCRRHAFLMLPAYLYKEHLDKGFYYYFDSTRIGIYSFEVSDESYINMKNYVDELYKNNKQLRYSILGVLYARLNIRKVRKNKMFCSEFICNVLNRANENLIDIVPELCSPMNLLTIKGLKCHYIGKVSDVVNMKNNNKLYLIYSQVLDVIYKE